MIIIILGRIWNRDGGA